MRSLNLRHLVVVIAVWVSSAAAHEPRVVAPGEGKVIDFPGHKTILLADHHSTPSNAAVMEIVLPPRTFGAPPHIHAREDEHFYVIEGVVEFLDREHTSSAGPGSLVVLPRGHLHGFWNVSDQPARMLLLVTPGEFASFFDAVVAQLRQQHADSPDQVGRIMAEVAARYEVTIHPQKTPDSALPLLPQ